MTQDKNTAQDELWYAISDEVRTYCSGSVREVSDITDAVTTVARSRIALAEKERDLMLRELQRVRVRLADELRDRAQDIETGDTALTTDPLYERLATVYNSRGTTADAYRAVADVLERGGEK